MMNNKRKITGKTFPDCVMEDQSKIHQRNNKKGYFVKPLSEKKREEKERKKSFF